MTPQPVIRLHPNDSVVIARTTLLPGTVDRGGHRGRGPDPSRPQGRRAPHRPGRGGPALRSNHRLRHRPHRSGSARACAQLGMGEFAKDYALRRGREADPEFRCCRRRFEGIRRADGRVATRNYIGILTSVNCSAHVAGLVADAFKTHPFTGFDPLADYPNVDGVLALTHKTGCGMAEGEPLTLLRRTLAAMRGTRTSPIRRSRPGLRGQPDRRMMRSRSSPTGSVHGHSGRWAAPAGRWKPASPSCAKCWRTRTT